MSSDLEDRHKLILSDGTKYIELEVDGDSAVKLKSDLLYAKRHMLAIEQMLPASVKHHQAGDNLEKLDYFLLVSGDQIQLPGQTSAEEVENEFVAGDTFVWTNKATTLLCKLRLEMNQMFHGGPRSTKMSLWNKCAKNMKQNGFSNVTGDGCRRKWHNLMMTYKRILESNNQGRSSWEFFNLVHSVMQQQATNDPAPSLIISTLSEPRKRKRRIFPDSVEESTQNGDLFEMPAVPVCNDSEETEYLAPKEQKNKNKNENFLKMIVNLRRDELAFQQQESDRRWEDRRQRRRDKLKFQEEKLRAINALTDTLQKLIEK